MIRNYLISHLRALWRNRTHAFVNLLGLSLGITCTIVLFLIIRFELSYDNFHEESDRIYRVVHEYINAPKPGYSVAMTYPLPPALRQDFPDLEYVALVDGNMYDPVINIPREDNSVEKFKEQKVVFVEPEFLKIFHYDWVEGNSDALKGEKTIVLTESVAKKYFAKSSPINKVINFNNEFDVTVTGVVKDPPLNTDLQFRMLLSSNLGANKRGWEDWAAGATSINCYVKLNKGVRQQDFEAKFKGWHMKYFTGKSEYDGKNRNYFLQPMKEIHFDNRFSNMGGRIVSYQRLLTLAAIGTLLLLTACINFINLNTVLIIDRSKEAGIRKVMGSSRAQLVFQFLGETFIITLLSLIISAGLVELALIKLTSILEYRLSFHPLRDPATTLFLIGLPIVVTLLAGLYPGVSLSRFQPVTALKSKLGGEPGQGITLRRSLIVFQLVISQVLVVCTIIVVQQINYFMAQPIGINSQAIVEFELPENKPDIIERLKERLKEVPGVENAAMSNTGATSGNNWGGDFEATVGDKLIKEGASIKIANEDFIDTYGIQLLHGENLLKSDTANRFLVNVAFTKILGFTNPADAIGTPVEIWGNKALITGVVNDFNTMPLQVNLQPTILLCGTGAYYTGAVRISSSNMKETLASVRKTWEEVYPKYVFEYTFLDETIAHFYDAERKTSYLIGLFAGVAIFIGCIGLFGLVSFMARRKTKEVGIRKTLGASVGQVISLFSKEFVVLILISFVIAAPLSYYFMEEWLSNFKYRIQPGALTFVLGVMVTFTVVIATVGIKSYRAAVSNPVDALRDE